MARTASIILTKEDKKAKIAELNESIKKTKALIKGVVAAAKENDKELDAATKTHANKTEALNIENNKYAKDLATFEAQKSALVNDTSIGANIGAPVVKRTRRTKAEMEAARAAASA
jgi:hypothetical protein